MTRFMSLFVLGLILTGSFSLSYSYATDSSRKSRAECAEVLNAHRAKLSSTLRKALVAARADEHFRVFFLFREVSGERDEGSPPVDLNEAFHPLLKKLKITQWRFHYTEKGETYLELTASKKVIVDLLSAFKVGERALSGLALEWVGLKMRQARSAKLTEPKGSPSDAGEPPIVGAKNRFQSLGHCNFSGFRGVGISRNAEGTFFLIVNVASEKDIPGKVTEFEGIEIQYRVMGEYRPRTGKE